MFPFEDELAGTDMPGGRRVVINNAYTTLTMPTELVPMYRDVMRSRHEEAVGIRAVAISPAGDELAFTGNDKTVRRFRIHDGMIRSRVGIDGPGVALAYSPDARFLAVAADRGGPLMWNLVRDRAVRLKPDPRQASYLENVTAVAFSPDSGRVAFGLGNRTFLVYPVEGGAPAVLPHDGTGVGAVVFSPD
jgi:WD40 repeat protein